MEGLVALLSRCLYSSSVVGKWTGIVIALTLVMTACARQRVKDGVKEYELRGQILAVDPLRQEVTIRHEDIPQFMPGMTMPFRVSDKSLLDGRVRGDLVKAILVVEDNDAHLRSLERTGHAPVPAGSSSAPMRILSPGEPIADATLIDESGARRHLADFRGKVLAVTFIYTRCPVPNFCPLMDRHFKAVQERIKGDPALSGKVHLLSISFDPGHDIPDVLARHAATLQADPSIWHFMTGEAPEVEQFARQFGVSIFREAGTAAEIVHNLRTAVIDPELRLAAILNGSEWTPSQLVAELNKVTMARSR